MRQRDRLEVRQQAAQPAMVHVGHAGVLGDLLDGVARLLLGAHEQHRAAAVGDLGAEALRVLQQRLGLEQVDDVDAAALTEDETAHLRVPAARLVAEVDAGLQQLPDAYVGHEEFSLWVCVGAAPGGVEGARTRRQAPGRAATSAGSHECPGSGDGESISSVRKFPARAPFEGLRAGPPFPYLRWSGPCIPARWGGQDRPPHRVPASASAAARSSRQR